MLLVLISAYSSSGHELLPTFWLGVITAIPRRPRRADRAHGRAAGETGLRFFGILPEDTRGQLYRVRRRMPNRDGNSWLRCPIPPQPLRGRPILDQPNKSASTVSSTCCRKLRAKPPRRRARSAHSRAGCSQAPLPPAVPPRSSCRVRSTRANRTRSVAGAVWRQPTQVRSGASGTELNAFGRAVGPDVDATTC